MGVGGSDQAGARQIDVYLFLVLPERGYSREFHRLQAGSNDKDRCSMVLNVPVVDDKFRGAKIGVGLDDRCSLLSSDIVGSPFIGFDRKALLIRERMCRRDSVDIIGGPVPACAEVSISDEPPRLEFMDVFMCYSDVQYAVFICAHLGSVLVDLDMDALRRVIGLPVRCRHCEK